MGEITDSIKNHLNNEEKILEDTGKAYGINATMLSNFLGFSYKIFFNRGLYQKYWHVIAGRRHKNLDIFNL